MATLKPHQAELLRTRCRAGTLPTKDLDGRVLRPLLGHGLVVETHGVIRPTAEGQALAGKETQGEDEDDFSLAPERLSEKQEEVLRYLLRQTGPVPADHLDGRVVRALSSRGLVDSVHGWVTVTGAAEPYLRKHAHKERRRGLRRAAGSPRSARGEAILRIVEQLEHAIPRDAELIVGKHPAYADDLLAGLRKLGREMA